MIFLKFRFKMNIFTKYDSYKYYFLYLYGLYFKFKLRLSELDSIIAFPSHHFTMPNIFHIFHQV